MVVMMRLWLDVESFDVRAFFLQRRAWSGNPLKFALKLDWKQDVDFADQLRLRALEKGHFKTSNVKQNNFAEDIKSIQFLRTKFFKIHQGLSFNLDHTIIQQPSQTVV